MDESVISVMNYLRETFGVKDADLRSYSPLTLAYIGDGIYDLIIRTIVVKQGNSQPNKLHKKTSALVKAGAQAEMMERILPVLSEEETAIYKRGRNAKSYTMAKKCNHAGLSEGHRI
jgi:ribonuclease-3 family protein